MISEGEVRHVARLARLGLTDEEVRALQTQLDTVLGYVEKLQSLDTADVEGTIHPSGRADVTRKDEGWEGLAAEAALANAPVLEDGFFRVPAVIDDFAPDTSLHDAHGAADGE